MLEVLLLLLALLTLAIEHAASITHGTSKRPTVGSDVAMPQRPLQMLLVLRMLMLRVLHGG